MVNAFFFFSIFIINGLIKETTINVGTFLLGTQNGIGIIKFHEWIKILIKKETVSLYIHVHTDYSRLCDQDIIVVVTVNLLLFQVYQLAFFQKEIRFYFLKNGIIKIELAEIFWYWEKRSAKPKKLMSHVFILWNILLLIIFLI